MQNVCKEINFDFMVTHKWNTLKYSMISLKFRLIFIVGRKKHVFLLYVRFVRNVFAPSNNYAVVYKKRKKQLCCFFGTKQYFLKQQFWFKLRSHQASKLGIYMHPIVPKKYASKNPTKRIYSYTRKHMLESNLLKCPKIYI
jgi:hypothetical protein